MYTIKVEGLKELQESFKKFPQIADSELQRATKDAGKEILRTEVKEAPHKTGALQRSIKWNYRPIVTEVYPTVDYAIPVHDGSKPHLIRPSRAKVLRFKTKSGKIVYTKLVNHPGNKPNKFVERTANRVEPKINDLFKKALNNIMKRI